MLSEAVAQWLTCPRGSGLHMSTFSGLAETCSSPGSTMFAGLRNAYAMKAYSPFEAGCGLKVGFGRIPFFQARADPASVLLGGPRCPRPLGGLHAPRPE